MVGKGATLENLKSVKPPADDSAGGVDVALVEQPCTWRFQKWTQPATFSNNKPATRLSKSQARVKCVELGPLVCKSIFCDRSRFGGSLASKIYCSIQGPPGPGWQAPLRSQTYTIYYPPASCFPNFPRYDSVGIGECMTPQGPRGNHCYDGPSFNTGTVRTQDECQQECEKIGHCSAYEWGRNNYYNCALYIHTSTANPPELASRDWTCNFWSAGPSGVNKVSRAHNFGHSGKCFIKQD